MQTQVGTSQRERIVGIDATRGIALFGMFAVHTLAIFEPSGDPTLTTMTAAGRSASTFALVAGISLAILSGGSSPAREMLLRAARVGIGVRAVLIAAIGLLLGIIINVFQVNVAGILVYYAVAFLLVIPILGWSIRRLLTLAAAIVLLSPAVAFVLGEILPDAIDGDPTPLTLLSDPLGLLSTIFVTGSYPVLMVFSYIVVGLAIGRLDLGSGVTAARLLGLGIMLAVAGWVGGTVMLFGLDAQQELFAESTTEFGSVEKTPTTVIWWAESESGSWWELAQRAPHSYSTFDLVHTIGFATALVGLAILIGRSRVGALLVKPLSMVGSMPLTIYTYHLLLLASWYFYEVHPPSFYVFMVMSSIFVAAVCKGLFGQGPLERSIGRASGAVRERFRP